MQKKKKLTLSSNLALVNSKIEHTKKITSSLLQYRKNLAEMSEEVKGYVLKVSNGNLLNAKLALWGALQRVEEMMKERREK